MRLISVILMIPVLLQWSCSDDSDLYVELDKLRAIGVASTPLVAKPSTDEDPQTITLTVYAAVPLEEEVTAEVFVDEDSPYAPSIDTLEIQADSASYVDYAKFRLFSIQAVYVVPSAELLGFSSAESSAQLRYGVRLTSPGEEEKVVGNLLVRPDGSEELSWEAPAIEITEPSSDASVSKNSDIDVKASITKNVEEDVKIGWFSGAGEVKNRRAEETEWKTNGDDTQTLVATVRGKLSRGFAIQVLDVRAE